MHILAGNQQFCIETFVLSTLFQIDDVALGSICLCTLNLTKKKGQSQQQNHNKALICSKSQYLRLYGKTRFLTLFYIKCLGLCKPGGHVVPLPLNNFRNEDPLILEKGDIKLSPNLLQNDQYGRASTGDFAGTSIFFCYYADFLLK